MKVMKIKEDVCGIDVLCATDISTGEGKATVVKAERLLE